MSQGSSEKDEKKKGPEKEFDPTGELWDRIVEDIAQRGGPCSETVEKLLEDACQQPARPPEPRKP